MDEYINIDNMMYKLSFADSLTPEQRNQQRDLAIQQVRNANRSTQTGCASCPPRVLGPNSMQQNDWQYGGIQSLVTNIGSVTCPTGKGSGSTVTLAASPNGGVEPYTVRFWRMITTTVQPVGGTASGITEGGSTSVSYVLSDADVAAATGNSAALAPSDVDNTTGAPVLGGATTAILAGTIRHFTTVVDSCSGTGAPGKCVQWCDLALVCVAPVCNFVVT